MIALVCITTVLVGCGSRAHTSSSSRGADANPPATAAAAAPQRASWQEIPIVACHPDQQQASVREAARSGQHPERLSLACPPTPFDAQAYRQHPATYLDCIEPGRALTPAAPAPGIPPLARLGPEHQTARNGAWTTLRVHALPRAPVNAASLDKGVFQNHLSAITVQCDDAGDAVLLYTPTPGTGADVRVVAASPVCTGIVRWVVTVTSSAPATASSPATASPHS